MFLDRLRSFLHEPPPRVLPPPVIVERAPPPVPRKLSFVEELARSRPLPIKTLQPADVAIKFVRWWLQKRQHDFPMLPDDLYDLQITWATSVGVRPLKRDPLLEQLRSLPHVKKDRANVLNDFDHSFIFDRMKQRGKWSSARSFITFTPKNRPRSQCVERQFLVWLMHAKRLERTFSHSFQDSARSVNGARRKSGKPHTGGPLRYGTATAFHGFKPSKKNENRPQRD